MRKVAAAETATRAKRSVFDSIYMFDPYQTPLTQFFLANKQAKLATGNMKFEIQEDTPVTQTLVIEALTGGATTEADVVISTGGNCCAAGDILRNVTNGENYIVTAIDTANTEIDIKRFPSGNITAAGAGSVLINCGPAKADGADVTNAVSTEGTFPYNYCQNFEKVVYMSGNTMATEMYGGNDWVNQRMKAIGEFKMMLERTFVYGRRTLDATLVVWATGGLLDDSAILTDVSQFVGGSAGSGFASEDYFFKTYCKALFAKGSNRKKLYCGAEALLGINDFSKVKQQTKVGEKQYGVDVQTILTPFGALDLVWHPVLESYYSNWAIGLDETTDYVKYRFQSANGINRDIRYADNLQSPGYDARMSAYRGTIGLHLAGGTQGVHRVLYPGASS
jgi:hypothetical protein